MSKSEIPKAYESEKYEDEIYAAWETSGFFNPDHLPGDPQEPFTIALPPPNVTGTLHLGHAVMLAIEDIMVRFHRLRGKRALWIPGTDHAGIATQTKVEKLLIESGLKDPRQELGREAFLAHVETFAAESHDTIVGQAKKMGASLDWSREAYTLDEARSLSVRTVFKMMYEDGLIYRGNRVINWCPRCKSTIADDEVEHKEVDATLYTFKYDHAFPISISTTRPETKFGDTAVGVHPDDDRYRALVGKEFKAHFAGSDLKIRVIADEHIDPAFGTGALGVTPAHSNVDADMGRAHKLDALQVIDEEGRMMNAPLVSGMMTTQAREKAVAWLREQGLLEKEEEVKQNLSVCYRCDTPIEPLPKTQWFIDVNKPFAFRASGQAPMEGLKDGEQVTLKSVMQHAVRSGQVKIMPDRFEKTYFHWIDNLRDWCISRQLWFGHRIPVWYKGEETSVGIEAPEGDGWEQDPDTLDTWFSSGLWTFSSLGWPEQTEDLKRFHPTSVLETGYDILFFWVARMILMTTYAIGEVPFHQVYLHGLVRDEQGKKMSKSSGNVIDPLVSIKEYGADATRLALVIGSSPGNDTRLSEAKIAGYRNFTNKLWNISRFVLTSVERIERVEAVQPKTLADTWILSRFGALVEEVTTHLEAHEFSPAGEKLRDFTWNEFADWYLEIAKLQREGETKASTDAVLLFVLERLLVLWHPFMPFVTEEIWKAFEQKDLLMVHPWPTVAGLENKEAERTFARVQEIVVAIRNLRAQYRVEPAKQIHATLSGTDAEQFHSVLETIARLARCDVLDSTGEHTKMPGEVSVVAAGMTVFIQLAGIVDLEQEKARLEKELASVRSYQESLVKKLSNQEFVAKAPAQVVEDMKQKQADAEKTLAALLAQRASL